jgi:hypothetical protein
VNEIVAAVAFRDGVYIFTRDGTIYLMHYNSLTGDIQFTKMATLFPS